MRLKSLCIAVEVLSMVIALQANCKLPHMSKPSGGSPRSNIRTVQNPSDGELLKQVEAFASSDEAASNNAWKSLQSLGRQDLIDGLTRAYVSSSADDHHRVLISFTFCKLNHDYAANRRIVLSSLSRRTPFKNFYGDWAVSLVRRLLIAGDNEVLADLFSAAEWSDGAMSEELSSAYSDAIVRDPQMFLRKLKVQKKTTQVKVYRLVRDNSLSPEDARKVRTFLTSDLLDPDLRPVARETLKALQD